MGSYKKVHKLGKNKFLKIITWGIEIAKKKRTKDLLCIPSSMMLSGAKKNQTNKNQTNIKSENLTFLEVIRHAC